MKTPIANRFSHIALAFAWVLALWMAVCGVGYGQGTTPRRQSGTQPPAAAQANAPLDTTAFDFAKDISSQLVAFEELYRLALAYSPAVKAEQAGVNAQLATYQLSKLQILQNMTGGASYSMGNQTILATGAQTTEPLAQISNGYRAGVNLAVSMHDLFGRPHQIRGAKANYDATVERKRSAEIQLKQDLFNLYQDLILSQRTLQIRLRDGQAILTAFQIAEAELQQGKILPEVQIAASTRYSESRIIVEQSKTQFIKTIYALELFVGVPIRQLKR